MSLMLFCPVELKSATNHIGKLYTGQISPPKSTRSGKNTLDNLLKLKLFFLNIAIFFSLILIFKSLLFITSKLFF